MPPESGGEVFARRRLADFGGGGGGDALRRFLTAMATSCLSLALTGKEGRESTSMRKPGRAGVGVGVVDVDSHSGKTDWLAGMEGEGARDMLPERSAMYMACGTTAAGLLSCPCVCYVYTLLLFSARCFLPRSFARCIQSLPAHP